MIALMNIFQRFISWLYPEPIKLAIVRKYQDANGAYVGELYMYLTIARKNSNAVIGYTMIGASLDTLPLDYTSNESESFTLDALHDFLWLPMAPNTVRVGGLTPDDDLRVRREIYALRRHPIDLLVQNRFIEYVLEAKEKGK